MKTAFRIGCLLLVLFLLPLSAMADDGVSPVMPWRELSAAEITAEMGVGWNLGNTMDGHTALNPSETTWQHTVTTQALITAVHDAGFNTLRLPVTWGSMIDDENGYKINEAWLSRVQDIADYAIRQDMYVIINIHHDGAEQSGWLRIAFEGEKLQTVKDKFAAVWGQIAETFRDYDEHMVFEAMNEVVGDDGTQAGVIRDFRIIESLNQIFVDTVRATGGNNARRWLVCPPRYTNIVNVLNPAYGFTLPNDSCVPARLMLSVHDYDWVFGLQDNMNATFWSQEKALTLSKNFSLLKEQYSDKGVPIILGEYGAANKNNTGNRAYYYEAMCRMSAIAGAVPCAWEGGSYDYSKDPDYSMSLFDRKTGEEPYPGIISAILRGFYLPEDTTMRQNILHLTKIESPSEASALPPFESIALPAKQIFMNSGDAMTLEVIAEPADRKDVVVYASTNPEVVSVSHGLLQAKAPGSAKITASSQAGDAFADMIVVVKAAAVDQKITAIETGESVTVTEGGTAQMDVRVFPADHTDAVYFLSGDPRIATVNGLGKLVGIAAGETRITIVTASGLKTVVPVTVEPAVKLPQEGVTVAIAAYYNDEAHNYYSNDVGESMTILGDGTYTLTFDVDTDLSDAGREAGVDSLAGAGAIYLFDISGRPNVLKTCDIHYDEVLLDGVPMTVVEHEPKSALKANGKLDTNDPINAWDGSYVKGVTATSDYNIEYADNPAPKTITVTFTISNWQYAD